MSFLSGVGYAATRLHSSQDLPSPLEYASMEKKWLRGYAVIKTSLPIGICSPLKYVSKERSGYAATWLRSDCIAA